MLTRTLFGPRGLVLVGAISLLTTTACSDDTPEGGSHAGGSTVGGSGNGGTIAGGNGGGGNGGVGGQQSGGGGAGGEQSGGGGAGGQGGVGGDTTGGAGGSMCMPVKEICDGKDNDCDGTADNGNVGAGQPCNTALPGICSAGTTRCDGVNGIVCDPTTTPNQVLESCNGLDDDCDGQTDEDLVGLGQACLTGLDGVCGTGTTVCGGVLGVTCMASVLPGQLSESCNGLDDDCNGQIDDAITQVGMSCTAPGFSGLCQFGTYSCPSSPPFQLVCDHPSPGMIAETCNSIDDDCNSTIDDPNILNGQACTTGLPGACAPGTTLCLTGSSSCQPTVQPGSQPELCNSVDDNCNGQTDEMNPTPACTSQNPTAVFVQTWACASGNCQVTNCQSGHADIDKGPANGCECSTDQLANICTNASTVNVPQSAVAQVTGVIESSTGSDFMTFTFAAGAVGTPFHPRVELVSAAGGQYSMDVLVDCANVAGCAPGGGSNTQTGIQVDAWEQNYNGYAGGPGCCSDSTPRQVSVTVRIYRTFADAPTCSTYQVQASNIYP
ncbi:MAG: MopE-related protein [Polyangiaceae bacterium]